jgi:hypothetical protein
MKTMQIIIFNIVLYLLLNPFLIYSRGGGRKIVSIYLAKIESQKPNKSQVQLLSPAIPASREVEDHSSRLSKTKC